MIALDEVLEGVEFVSAGQLSEHSAYLCAKTGKVYFQSEAIDEPLPEDIEDSEKYIPLPDKKDLGLGKPLALSFTGEHLPKALPNVEDIFSRAGAYPRFRDLLEQHRMLERWYQYENDALKKAVRDWCKGRCVITDG